MSRRRGRSVATAVAVVVAAALVAAGCSDDGGGEADERRGPVDSNGAGGLVVVEDDGWAEVFAEHAVAGTFALHEVGSDTVRVHDAERAADPVLPASTFKILNSLVALETGVVADVDEVVAWDGVERSVPAWNRDHSLRTGIEVSAVWMYQELARRIGPARMAEHVTAAGYGNADIGGPIDEFWLRGDLRTSPLEQIDFLARFVAGDLPFDPDHLDAVRDILVRESGDGWVWGHKTGTALAADPVLGWLVGYTEHDGRTWVFAMNVDLGSVELPNEIDPEVRRSISARILESAGALPPAP